MGGPARQIYEFGSFRLDVADRLLLRGRQPVPLTPKAFDLLLMLVENHGHLVLKDELLHRVWGGSFVEEAVVSVNVSLLRKTLDDGQNEQYIKTVPKQGYRFIAPVRESPDVETIAAKGRRDERATGLKNAWQRRAIPLLVLGAMGVAGFVLAEYWLGHGRQAQPAGRIMLAVLPFDNLSGDPEQEYFSDGLTEEMITQLTHVNPESLAVVARTSAMQYKYTRKSAAQIGRELRVDYLLEGSVRRAGERVRISAQLIRVRDETHRWAEDYDEHVRDILTLQDNVARAIAGEISLKLSPTAENRRRLRPVVPKAHELYLKGRYFWNKRTEDGFKRATESFKEAIVQDPTYALPYVGLADTYVLLGYYSMVSPHEVYPEAERAARKAIEMDEALGEAHSSLAGVFMDYRWTWPEVEREYKRALELNPGYAVAHQWYGNYLSAMGRSEEAIKETLRARELDPLSLVINTNVAWAYHLARQHDKALDEAKTTLQMDPNFYWAHLLRGRAFEAKGMHGEAIAAFEKAVAFSGGSFMVLSELGHAYAAAGRRGDAHRILRQLSEVRTGEYRSPYDIALVYVGLGQKDDAFYWLEKSYQERARALGFAKVEPRLDPLRSDPRFADLLRRMALQ
jgi:TolB-like protein/DNA-binding winged helix-turn-helix (wHTH) protein/Tfp pilus assembly protein PilF